MLHGQCLPSHLLKVMVETVCYGDAPISISTSEVGIVSQVVGTTSAVRAFGPGYFRDSASVLEPRHIGARPKGTSFWPRLSPEAIASVFCLGSGRTEAIGVQYFF